MSFFIPDAMAQAAPAPQGPDFSMFILMIGFGLFMYFLIIRPQRKRQKEHQELTGNLSKGDEVVLNSGMLGKIKEVDENYILVNAGNNVEMRFQKIAVHAVLPKGTIKGIEGK